jgi:2,3-bisphosphoglycerate-dependent phosphoglycerate mutase
MKTKQDFIKSNSMQHKTISVVLIRHAQSQWNQENRFTGWANPALTAAGEAEAQAAGQWLRTNGYRFDVAYSSWLQRAIITREILLDRIGQSNIPRREDWRLNERHYGVLQGVNKAEAAAQAGEQQVWRWRRGYEDKAEPLLRQDPEHPLNNPIYADVDPHLLPDVENLAQTRARVMSFWMEHIAPRIHKGERVLISAHGNTLRALLMDLAEMSVEQVESFEIPTATPIEYRFDGNAQPLDWRYLDMTADKAKSA